MNFGFTNMRLTPISQKNSQLIRNRLRLCLLVHSSISGDSPKTRKIVQLRLIYSNIGGPFNEITSTSRILFSHNKTTFTCLCPIYTDDGVGRLEIGIHISPQKCSFSMAISRKQAIQVEEISAFILLQIHYKMVHFMQVTADQIVNI